MAHVECAPGRGAARRRLASTALPAWLLLAILTTWQLGCPSRAHASNPFPNPKASILAPGLPTFPLARGGFLATATGPAMPLTLTAATGLAPQARSLIGLEYIERRLGGWLFYWQPSIVTLGYRHVDARVLGHNEDHYFAALAYNADGRGSALELNWITNDVVEGDNALSFGTSFLFRRSPRVRTAVLLRHLNRPRFLDGHLERLYAFSIAVKPMDPRLTLAADFVLRDRGDDRFIGHYGFELAPTRGVYVAGSLATDGTVRMSIAVGSDSEIIGWGLANGNGLHRQFVQIGYEQQVGTR